MTRRVLVFWIAAGVLVVHLLIAVLAARDLTASDWLAALGAGAVAQDSGDYFATNDWRG